jgi:hypothetical protein
MQKMSLQDDCPGDIVGYESRGLVPTLTVHLYMFEQIGQS